MRSPRLPATGNDCLVEVNLAFHGRLMMVHGLWTLTLTHFPFNISPQK